MSSDITWAWYWATITDTSQVIIPAKGAALPTGKLAGKERVSGNVWIQPSGGKIRTALDEAADATTGNVIGKDIRDTLSANNAIHGIRDIAEAGSVLTFVAYEVEP